MMMMMMMMMIVLFFSNQHIFLLFMVKDFQKESNLELPSLLLHYLCVPKIKPLVTECLFYILSTMIPTTYYY